jgi:hypothetical protein
MTSILSTAACGTRPHAIQPPKGSFRGMPSSKTAAREAPLPPTPLRETPWDVGLAVRLPDRRKSVKPGTCRRTSSIGDAGAAARSSEERATTLAGVSRTRAGARAAVTVRVSEKTARESTISTRRSWSAAAIRRSDRAYASASTVRRYSPAARIDIRSGPRSR